MKTGSLFGRYVYKKKNDVLASGITLNIVGFIWYFLLQDYSKPTKRSFDLAVSSHFYWFEVVLF